jgi:hypothetical protein
VTRKLFPHLTLDNQLFRMAFSEAISHIELLEELEDVSLVGEGTKSVRWNGTENFAAFFEHS